MNMTQRCLNPNNTHYKYYGGRGITIEESWLDFRNWLKDNLPRAKENHDIDRIDNDGPYSLSNTIWVPLYENRRKRRGINNHPGVSPHHSGKWRARIMIEGKEHWLGLFSDIEEAKEVYNVAAQLHYGEYRRIPLESVKGRH